MYTFKKIVLTTDFSENADAATPLAVEMARTFGSELYLLHIGTIPAVFAVLPTAEIVALSPPQLLQHMPGELKELEAKAERISKHYGMRVMPVLRVGQDVSEIVRFAKEEQADCVVIATHGRTGLAHLFSGSVAERVVRFCPCPVLTVRPEPARQYTEEQNTVEAIHSPA